MSADASGVRAGIVLEDGWASDLSGERIDSGHHMAEENPDDLVIALLTHLGPDSSESV